MALEQTPLSQPERIKIAEGRIETSEFLIRKWWARRQGGDQVPSKAILGDWIKAEIKTLRSWRAELTRAQAPPLSPVG